MPRFLSALGVAVVVACGSMVAAAERVESQKSPVPSKKVSAKKQADGRSAPKASAETKPSSAPKLRSSQLDKLIASETPGVALKTISDEQFIRRVTIDLLGRQPKPDEMRAFLETKNNGQSEAKRRAVLVNQLLASKEFGANWANYWSDAIAFRVPPPELTFLNYGPFKEWLATNLNRNVHWNLVTAEILTASGLVKENPEATFVAFHDGNAQKLAAETARIWLGVQIQCAECHDHPFEDWKRTQFHELAAFYARAKNKIGNKATTNDGTDRTVLDAGKGEYKMPNAEDPLKDGTVMAPVFMTGVAMPLDQCDADRREMLAKVITAPDNPWFARAYVNRMWSRLIGQGFYEPVDDMGSHRTGRLPQTHTALAEQFVNSGYDVKDIFRLIINTQLYQRDLSNSSASEEASPYAAAKAGKLRGDEVFESLVTAVGLPNITPPAVKPTKEIRFPPPPKSTRDLVNDTFGYDPSLSPDDVYRSMGQAMMLMNNDQIAAQINADPKSETMLAKLVAAESDDTRVVEQLFLGVLARRPTANEVKIAKSHLKKVGKRGAAFEDLLWSLINSTEFTTKR
jgi:hypothetical protein